MAGIREFTGKVFPLNRDNVDTDQIIPKQFLKRIDRHGFGKFVFYHWRFNDDGSLNENFELNQKKYQGTSILVGGKNFGCGSSREHAPWALLDYGFQIIIAPSFGDIFYNNCMKNGILPIQLSATEVDTLLENGKQENYELFVSLVEQTVEDKEGFSTTFAIDPYRKEMLINGWDEISITLTYENQIKQYELSR